MHSEGCRCRQCFGLFEHMLGTTGRTHGLEPTRVEVFTFGPEVVSLEDFCRGTMLCECRRCSAERAERVNNGVKPDLSNPFRKAA